MADASMSSAVPSVLGTPLDAEPLELEAEVDPNDAEQTWPTEEELRDAALEQELAVNSAMKIHQRKVRVPKGWSSYQAAWIPDEEA